MIVFGSLGRLGRVGNQWFQVASTIGIAVKNQQTFYFPKWRNYDHLERFGSSEDIDIYKFFEHDLPEMATGIPYQQKWIDWGYRELRLPVGNWDLAGHMQSEKYFAHCEPLIRYYLTPKKLSDYSLQGGIAVHLRCGDYDNHYHPVQQIEYYEQALEKMPNQKVYVFSDEPAKAKKIFSAEYEYIEGNHYMTDLYLMSTASNFIIANSTFSWIGAWLSTNKDKIVCAPKRWFGDHVGLETKDIYCKNWIVL